MREDRIDITGDSNQKENFQLQERNLGIQSKQNPVVEFILNQEIVYSKLKDLIELVESPEVMGKLKQRDIILLQEYLAPYKELISYEKLKQGEDTNVFASVANSEDFKKLTTLIQELQRELGNTSTQEDYKELGKEQTKLEALTKQIKNQPNDEKLLEDLRTVQENIERIKASIKAKEQQKKDNKQKLEPLRHQIKELESSVLRRISQIIRPNSDFSELLIKYRPIIQNVTALRDFINFRIKPIYPDVFAYIQSKYNTLEEDILSAEFMRASQNATRYELMLKELIKPITKEIDELEKEIEVLEKRRDDNVPSEETEMGNLEALEFKSAKLISLESSLGSSKQFVKEKLDQFNASVSKEEANSSEKYFISLRSDVIEELESVKQYYKDKAVSQRKENTEEVKRLEHAIRRLKKLNPYNEKLREKRRIERKIDKLEKKINALQGKNRQGVVDELEKEVTSLRTQLNDVQLSKKSEEIVTKKLHAIIDMLAEKKKGNAVGRFFKPSHWDAMVKSIRSNIKKGYQKISDKQKKEGTARRLYTKG